MTQRILLKRSATPGKVPLTTDLNLGELAINTYDGKAYIKKNDGTESIVQLGGGGGAVGGSYVLKTADFAADANSAYIVDTSTSAITVTLPASPAENDTIILVDFNLNSQANNIIVARNGKTISNLAEDLTIDYNGISVQLTYHAGNWIITDTGNVNNNGFISTTEYTATAGQTVFNVEYPSAGSLQVYVNGVQYSLAAGDYTATDGLTVTLTSPLVVGDLVKFVTFNAIGSTANNLLVSEVTATAGQTTFAISYNAGLAANSLMVYKNGVQLSQAQYTATDGSNVVLNTAASVGDIVKLVSIKGLLTSGYAPVVSPTFTGVPLAPTAPEGSNTQQIATTAFAQTAISSAVSTAVNGINNTLATTSRLTPATVQTASTTLVEFTAIPAWVNRITVMLTGVSTSGVSPVTVQLGTSTAYENATYVHSVSALSAAAVATTAVTSGFQLTAAAVAANNYSGSVVLTRLTGNVWVAASHVTRNDAVNYVGSGAKTLAGALTRLKVTAVNGTDTFDAGQINIIYE